MKRLLTIAVLIMTLSVGCAPLLTVDNSGDILGDGSVGASGITIITNNFGQ